MQTNFLILIGVVFVLSICFIVVIWTQTVRYEKKAIEARDIQEQHKASLKQQIMAEKLAEREQRAAEAAANAAAEAQAAAEVVTQPQTASE